MPSSKFYFLTYVLLFFVSFSTRANKIFVTPTGSGSGVSWANPARFDEALLTISTNFDTLLLQEGNYSIPATFNLSINKNLTILGSFKIGAVSIYDRNLGESPSIFNFSLYGIVFSNQNSCTIEDVTFVRSNQMGFPMVQFVNSFNIKLYRCSFTTDIPFEYKIISPLISEIRNGLEVSNCLFVRNNPVDSSGVINLNVNTAISSTITHYFENCTVYSSFTDVRLFNINTPNGLTHDVTIKNSILWSEVSGHRVYGGNYFGNLQLKLIRNCINMNSLDNPNGSIFSGFTPTLTSVLTISNVNRGGHPFISPASGNFRLFSSNILDITDYGDPVVLSMLDQEKKYRRVLQGIDLGCFEAYPNFAGSVIYVDAGNTSPASLINGTTWARAFKTLDEALDVARVTPSVNQIRMGPGIYKPASKEGFRLPELSSGGLQIIGGYEVGQTILPDPHLNNLTILDGDISGNDILNDLNSNKSDNAVHVLSAQRFAGQLTLLGLTIQNGASKGGLSNDKQGGGVFLGTGNSTLVVNNCLLSNNYSFGEGGAVSLVSPNNNNFNSRTSLFVNNKSEGRGGAISFRGISFFLENGDFVRNEAGNDGGAIHATGATASSDNLYVLKSHFFENKALNGGAMYLFGFQRAQAGEVAEVLRNKFYLNEAVQDGGAIFSSDCDGVRTGVNLFSSNNANRGGAGFFTGAQGTRHFYFNNVFYRNQATTSGGALEYFSNEQPSEAYNNIFQENSAGVVSDDVNESPDKGTFYRNNIFDNPCPDNGTCNSCLLNTEITSDFQDNGTDLDPLNDFKIINSSSPAKGNGLWWMEFFGGEETDFLDIPFTEPMDVGAYQIESSCNPLLVTRTDDDVTNPECGMLRYAIEYANINNGGDILFDASLDNQTITLFEQLTISHENTSVDAQGKNITIRTDNSMTSGAVFSINAKNVTLNGLILDGLKDNASTHAKCVAVFSGDDFRLENMTMKNFNETGAVIQGSEKVLVKNCVFHSLGTVGLALINCENSFVLSSFFGMDGNGNAYPSFDNGALIVGGNGNKIGGVNEGNFFGNIQGLNSFAINLIGNDNIISDNTLGLNPSDVISINSNDGIIITGQNNRIFRNVIGNHLRNGIVVKDATTSNNLIYENYIGTNVDNNQPCPNEIGVLLMNGANNNQIGEGNIIVNNEVAIFVQGAGTFNNWISKNKIYGNISEGIKLENGGNNGKDIPLINDAFPNQITGICESGDMVEVFLDSPTNNLSISQGREFLGTAITTGSSWIFVPTVSLNVGDRITATATDANRNTSSFSIPLEIQPLTVATLPPGNRGIYLEGNVVSGSHLETSSVPSNETDNICLSAWVKLQKNPSTLALVAYNGNSSANGYGIYIAPDRRASVFIAGLGGVNFDAFVEINKWTHIAITRTSGLWELYLNGVSMPYITSWPQNSAFAPPTGSLLIGNGAGAINPFPGQIDEVRIFNTSRTVSQIQTDMSSITPNGAVGYWNFESQSGTIEVDASGNGFDASFVNNPLRAIRVTDNTDNGGVGLGSLRQAINDANSDADKDYIDFSAEVDVLTIQPSTSYIVSNPLIIDGFSKYHSIASENSRPNTNLFGQPINAKLNVIINGDNAGESSAFFLRCSNSEFKGLVINGFDGLLANGNAAFQWNPSGVEIYEKNKISGCFIGTDRSGTTAVKNGKAFLVFGPTSTTIRQDTIGGNKREDINLISGNGAIIDFNASFQTYIKKNYFGTTASGDLSLANELGAFFLYGNGTLIDSNVFNTPGQTNINFGYGISNFLITNNYFQINPSYTTLGGNQNGIGIFSDNSIIPTFNNQIGKIGKGNHFRKVNNAVVVNGIGATNNSIVGNYFSESNVAISLTNGANNSILSPDILTASTSQIFGLSETQGDTIHVYVDTMGTASIVPQGYRYLGYAISDASNEWQLNGSFPVGKVVTATATRPGVGTSEFSHAALIVEACNPLIVTSISDDGSCGTLRAAIEFANSNPGLDTIKFD
ncbi:MAG: LamG-like jellyroll fold domain-containing protein, partial [Cytophagales bacterium]